jgi:hypothetical protein
MLSAPTYTGTKVGAILYGLAAGVAVLVVIVFAATVLGVLIALLADATGWIGLGESKPWLPLALGEYSIVPGVVVGAFVCWKIWKSRLWPPQTQ